MFAELINAFAKSSRSKDLEPYRPRPSSAGPERCLRALVYEANGNPGAPRRGRSILAMRDSSEHEVLTIEWFQEAGFSVRDQQRPVEITARGLNPSGYVCRQCARQVPPNKLHGHIDWVAKFVPVNYETRRVNFKRPRVPKEILEIISKDKAPRLWEHKALSTYAVGRILAGSLPWDNIVQTVIYLKAEMKLDPKIKKASLLIKDKNSSQFVEFEIRYQVKTDVATIVRRIVTNGDFPAVETKLGIRSKNIVRDALKKFRTVDRYVKTDRIPDRPFPLGTVFPCGWCPWEKVCWKGYLGEVRKFTKDRALSEEVETAARFYKQLGAQIREAADEIAELKKTRADTRTSIIEFLNRKKILSGRAGQYFIEFRRAVKKGNLSERLFVKRIKAPHGKNNNRRGQ